VHWEDGSVSLIDPAELPLTLPSVEEYKPSESGESPLARATDWLDVVDTDGALVGTVRGVFDFGSGDMLDVVRPDGGSELFEFSQEVVPEIDLDAGRLTVVRPEELVEDRNGEVKR
jgi:hypothetical protein